MSNDLIIKNMNTALAVTKPEYNLMLKNIQDRMPAVTRDTINFHKSHSQFMQVPLRGCGDDLTHSMLER